MHRLLIASSVALLTLAAASPAFADDPPPLEAVGPGRNEIDAVLQRRREAHDFTGVTIDMRASLLVPAGDSVSGASMSGFGPGTGFSLTLGLYPVRHFGVLFGFRGSYGHSGFDGCDASASDASCGGYSVQVPAMLEYDVVDRTRGLFLQGGLGLFTSYHAYGDATTMTLTNNFAEYKAAVGWRIPFRHDEARPSPMGLEIFAGADFGEFASAEVHDVNGDFSGSITTPAWHYTFEIGVGAHFTP
jgi:hypothetical protein